MSWKESFTNPKALGYGICLFIETHPSSRHDCPNLKYLSKICSPQHSLQKHRHKNPFHNMACIHYRWHTTPDTLIYFTKSEFLSLLIVIKHSPIYNGSSKDSKELLVPVIIRTCHQHHTRLAEQNIRKQKLFVMDKWQKRLEGRFL